MRAIFAPDSVLSGCRQRSIGSTRMLLAIGAGNTCFPLIAARSIHEVESSGDTTSATSRSSARCARPCGVPALRNPPRRIRCGTRSRPICSNRAMTSARSGSCSVTPKSAPRWCTRMCSIAAAAASSARSTDCRIRSDQPDRIIGRLANRTAPPRTHAGAPEVRDTAR